MSCEILRLDDAEHFDELMAVFDTAFNRERGAFAQLLPGRYQPTPEHVGHHYAAREDGRIVAALGVYPIRWHIGGCALDVAGIGAVSTHPDWRGRGLMGALLSHVVNEVRQREFHLSWLGGQRQRYRHYGWERGGIQLQIELSRANLRHERSMHSLPAVSLAPMDEAGAEELALLHRWHDAQPMRCARAPEDFPVVLSHWHAQPLIARDAEGAPAGYAVLDREGIRIPELVGRDDAAAKAIARAIIEYADAPRLTLQRPALPCALHHWLAEVSESVHCAPMGNWQVLDWPRVLAALLAARCAVEPTMDGSVVVGIEGLDRALRLSVDNGEASVAWSRATPILKVDAVTLTRLLLGPLKPSQVASLPAPARVLDAWCPLPAAIPPPDKV